MVQSVKVAVNGFICGAAEIRKSSLPSYESCVIASLLERTSLQTSWVLIGAYLSVFDCLIDPSRSEIRETSLILTPHSLHPLSPSFPGFMIREGVAASPATSLCKSVIWSHGHYIRRAIRGPPYMTSTKKSFFDPLDPPCALFMYSSIRLMDHRIMV